MNYRINVLPEFAKNLRRLSKKYRSIKQDYANFIKELHHNPNNGVEIGVGLRKVRMAIGC